MSALRHWFAAALLLAACEFAPSEQFAPVLNVQCYLPAGESLVVRAHVNRTFAVTEPPAADFAGAEPVIRYEGDSIRLEYDAGDRYVSPGPVEVRAGQALELTVTHPGFDTVRGRTTVPDSFSILFPADGDSVTPRDSLVWSPSRSSRGYYIAFRSAPPNEYVLDFLFPNDTTQFNLPFIILSRAPAGFYSLTIAALDSNYYDWLRRYVGGPGGFNTSDSFSLSGGVGVFGSGIERTLEFCLRCDSATGKGARQARPAPYLSPARPEVDNRPGGNIIYPRLGP